MSFAVFVQLEVVQILFIKKKVLLGNLEKHVILIDSCSCRISERGQFAFESLQEPGATQYEEELTLTPQNNMYMSNLQFTFNCSMSITRAALQ